MKTNLTLILFFLFTQLSAVDLQQLTNDTQKVSQNGATTNLVWWIPVEYWEESLRNLPSLTAEQKAQFKAVLEEYTTFAVVNATIGPFGGITNKSEKEIRENSKFTVNGRQIGLLTPDDLTPDARNFFAMMTPMMAQMLGQFGEGMAFLVFPNIEDGEPIIDPRKDGGFIFESFENTYKWRLPLGSLLPPVFDPETGEEFPGNYQFNPFTGTKLIKKES